MIISRPRALLIAVGAICAVFFLQALISFGCYKSNFSEYLNICLFVAIPLIPAFVFLGFRNPLPAVGACVFFAPWLIFAWHTICVRPYSGGGDSMIYVAVLIWGTPSAIVGAFLAALVIELKGIEIK